MPDFTPETIPNEIAEEIFEGLYSYIDSGEKSCHPFTNVGIWELHKFDPINRGACGTYYKDGEPWFDFEIRDGNWNGSEIVRITDPEELSTPKRYYTRYFFSPDANKIGGDSPEDHQERMGRAWYILKNNKRMQEMQSKMAYDLTFCPASKTREHYNNYAKSISAIINSEQVEIN